MDRKILVDFALMCKRHDGYKAVAESVSKEKTVLAEQVMEGFIADSTKQQQTLDIPTEHTAKQLIWDELERLEREGGFWAWPMADGRTLGYAARELLGKVEDLGLDAEMVLKPMTFYLAKEVHANAKDKDKARLIEVLENYTDEHGNHPYREMVKKDIHHKTLDSIATELVMRRDAKNGQPIPEPIDKAMKIHEIFRAKVRTN